MAKIDFKTLVESLLFEDQNSFLQTIKTNIPAINAGVLTAIYNELTKTQPYIAGERWEPYLEFTPVFNVVVLSFGTKYEDVRNALKQFKTANNRSPDADDFYTMVEDNIKNNTQILSYIKPLDRYTTNDWNKVSPDVRNTYLQALKKQTDQILIQNVWPQVENMSIVDAVTTILKNRLTGLERLRLKFIVPLNSLQSELGNFDNVMLDVIKNYQAYSSGSKKYSKNVIDVLQNINVIPEDFVKIATYTIDLYKLIITNKFRNMADKVIASSLTNENINKFAKEGIATFNANGNISESRDKYTLSFIERGNTDPGNKLINLIKSMSTGVRVKDQAWQKLISQRLSYLSQAASALMGFSGQSLYGGPS